MYIILQSDELLCLDFVIERLELLQKELELLLKKQEALKQGAAYHGQLIKIKDFALRKVLCVDSDNEEIYSKIYAIEQQELKKYYESGHYPKKFWEEFGKPDNEFRKYWISQWKNYNHYQTYLNKTLGE